MPNFRTGWLDNMHGSRLNHLTGTAYPAVPAATYLALFSKMPLSDGTGGVEATGTRPAITLGAPLTDGNNRQYITNAAAVTGITLTNTSPAYIVGFGIYGASTAGTLYYADRLPSGYQVAAGATTSVPATGIKVYAEPPTI